MIMWFKGKSNMMEVDKAEAAAKSPVLTNSERQRLIAASIDAASDARYKAAQEAKLKDPKRKLHWKPDIGPTSPVWDAVRKKFRHYLMTKSVLSVLEAQFDEVQRLYIHPPAIDGEILFIQNRDSALYNAFFRAGGKFHGVQNNLATKLTMLKFGLPIAPLTLNNILNAAKDDDLDDEEDDPEDLPRVQRIMYAEKPLEFLNKYHERSQGYPIIRREVLKYSPQPSGPRPPMRHHHGSPTHPSMAPSMPSMGVPTPTNPQLHPHHDMSSPVNAPMNPPIIPGTPAVGMRGGAGAPEAEEVDRQNQSGVVDHDQPEVNKPSLLSKSPEDLKAIAALEKQMEGLDAEQAKAENAARMQPTPAVGLGGMVGVGGMPTLTPPMMNTAPRFNKSRNEAETAGKHPAQKWVTWSAESRTLDALHTSSYTKDQGVVVPGRAPTAPMYSESLELQLKVGNALPTIYSQRLTPTDIRQLQEYNQILRNAVLERMWACPICNYSIKAYEEEEKIKHIQQHQDREKVDGVCVWCGDTQWGFMSTEQKAKHQRHHIETEDTMKMKIFWDAHDCPACNTSFKHMKPEDIVAHCINRHAPGTVQFCDRCGIHEIDLNRVHHEHHDRKCKEQLPSTPQSDFCPRCGKDVSKQTPEQAVLHTRDCHVNGGHFCQTCGLDVAHFTSDAHRQHALVCKRPGGPKKTYCRKCGKHLAEKGTVEWHSHNETCWKKRDPPVHNPMSHADEFAKLAEQKEKIAVLNAQWTAKKDYVERREGSLEQRDNDLKAAEVAFNARKDALWSHHQEQQEVLNEGVAALTAQQQGLAPPVSDLGMCPFDECMDRIGTMSRQELFNHLHYHAQESRDAKMAGIQFNCQIMNSDGTVCGVVLDPSHTADFGGHLVHRLGATSQQAAAKQAAQYTAGTNARLRMAAKNLRAANQAGHAYGGAATRIGDQFPLHPHSMLTPTAHVQTTPPPPSSDPSAIQSPGIQPTASLTPASRAEAQRSQKKWATEAAEEEKLRKLQALTGYEPMSEESRSERNRTQDYWADQMRKQAASTGQESMSKESRSEQKRTQDLWADQMHQQDVLKRKQDKEAASEKSQPPPPPSSPLKTMPESSSQRTRRLAKKKEESSKKDVEKVLGKLFRGTEVLKAGSPIDPTDVGKGSASHRAKRAKTRHADPVSHPVTELSDEEEEDSATAEDLIVPKRKGRPAKMTHTPPKTKKRKQIDVEVDDASPSTAASRQAKKVSSPAKKQKKSAEPVEPPRRATRATSTPAHVPKKPEASTKKTAGRRKVQPPTDDEDEDENSESDPESEEEVPVLRISPLKRPRKSLVKK